MTNAAVVSFTETAREYIQDFIASSDNQAGLRIAIKKTGCSGFAYAIEVMKAPQANDLCFIEHGIRLFIEPSCVKIVQDMVIDLEEDGNRQKKLVFNNPNVVDSCGCGESFTVKEG